MLSDINYFEVQNRIITVHYESGSFEFYSTMSKIEESLFGKGFVRIHRAYLVARRYIQTITSGEVKLLNGVSLPVGGRYSANLQEIN